MANPLLAFRVDQGGMASHGGFVGVSIALLWYARKQKCDFLELGDVVVTLAPLGLMLGRIANFINGELWGRVTTVSWAVIFPDSPKNYNVALQKYGAEPRHPSQLYEATWRAGSCWLRQWRFWCKRPSAGQLSGEFLIGYGIMRILGETFREPDANLILGLSRGQFYSIFMILAGAITIWIVKRQGKYSHR